MADVTVVDPAAAWVYDDATALSKSRNTPFWGASLTGRAADCLVAGRVRLRAGRIAAPATGGVRSGDGGSHRAGAGSGSMGPRKVPQA